MGESLQLASWSRWSRERILPLAIVALLAVVTSCSLSSGSGAGGGGDTPDKPSESPEPQAKITVEPTDGTKEVKPTTDVTVMVRHGSVKEVSVTAEPTGDDDQKPGLKIDGEQGADGTHWTSTEPLLPATTYTVQTTAVDENGRTTSTKTSFTTLEPDGLLQASIAPLDSETVGVGMPINLYLSNPVADEFKDEVEKRLELDMSEPVTGAWHWIDDETLSFRPKEYWPAGEHVTLETNWIGVRAGDGVWGDQSRHIEFDVGERHISVVKVKKHRMTVSSGGEVVQTLPISAGEPENPSSSGIHVALAKEGHIVMDSSSYGVPVNSPDGYRTPTDWNVRITWSGQFVHSAPWSIEAQGERNVSHGCVNLSPSNAKWFYDFTRRGDIIKVVGSKRQVEPGNGWTHWNVPWEEWVKGSALDQAVKP